MDLVRVNDLEKHALAFNHEAEVILGVIIEFTRVYFLFATEDALLLAGTRYTGHKV